MWDLSSTARDQTHVPGIARRILNHWTTREVPSHTFQLIPYCRTFGCYYKQVCIHFWDQMWVDLGYPGGSVVKNLRANAGDAGDMGLIPGWGRSPGGGSCNSHQSSCLENPMEREAWWAIVHGVTKSRIHIKRSRAWVTWSRFVWSKGMYSLIFIDVEKLPPQEHTI